MSERRGARSDPADESEVQAQVEAAADELYALPPDDFSAARDELVKQAREQRNQPLAREFGKLRKPTQSAWLINLLWRDQREVMEQLFELASELGQAQAAAAGAALRELTQQRRQIENALLRRAVELASQAGVRVSDSVTREAQETLGAALALPDVADAVRSGHLVKPATYAGFGGGSPAGAARPAAPPARRAPIDLQAVQRRRAAQDGAAAESATTERQTAETEAEAEAARQAEDERRAAEERQAAEERKRQLEAAQQALGAAEAELRSATRAAEAATQRHADLRTRLDTLREQLQRLETDVERAEHAASEAEAAQQHAHAAYAEAETALTEAQRAV
jgi:hypothetical protein